MTGMRTVTAQLGWLDQAPPDAIAEERVTGPLMRLPEDQQEVAKQLAHWGYGTVGGAAFGLLPRVLRGGRWSGPLYGVTVWLLFEAAVAPVLGLRQAKERRPLERLVLAGDHMLYGIVVASTPWPQSP